MAHYEQNLRLGGLGMALLATLAAGACEKLNPNFIEPTETGTMGPTDTTSATGTMTSTGPDGTTTTTGPVDSSSGGLACAPQYDSIRIAIFEPKCTGDTCHVGKEPAGSLDLTTAEPFGDLLDVPSSTCVGWSRVVAQSPELSILYARVAGIATCDPVDPVEHEELTQPEKDCLAGWIDSIEDCERCGGAECIDPNTDIEHCGECGVACPIGAPCVDGTCDCRALLACGPDCIDPQDDPLHCGECDADCNGAACLAGMCDCAIELLNCGACIDPMTNEQHCGDCEQPCGLGETCQAASCQCSDIPVSFAADVQPIFTANCTAGNCHDASNPKAGLNLEAGMAITSLVGVPAGQCNDGRLRVAPGDLGGSYIWDKLMGMNLCAGVQMPQSGGPGSGLTDAELDPIAAWICQGASDN